MKNLNKLFNECKSELDAIGVQYGNIVSITSNSRAKQRWGLCSKRGNRYSIQISSRLLQDDVSDKAVKSTILHEMLHTCKNCMQHKNEWLVLANKVNRAYNYNIKRTDSYEDKGIDPKEAVKNYKYAITCKKCGKTFYRMRMSEVIKNPQYYRCPCGGELFVTVR